MAFDLKIKFGKTASKNYKQAVDIARKFTEFAPAGQTGPNTLIITTDTIAADSKQLELLWPVIECWKSTELFINGKRIAKTEANRAIASLCCYAGYQKAVIQQFYCQLHKHLPGWGCKRLNAVMRHQFTDYEDYSDRILWYQSGHFIADNIWKIDKKEIVKILKREADLKYLRLCPMFDFSKVQKALDELPDEVDLNKIKGWEKDYIRETGIEPRLVGIRPIPEPVNDFKGCYEQIDIDEILDD